MHPLNFKKLLFNCVSAPPSEVAHDFRTSLVRWDRDFGFSGHIENP